MSQWADLGVNKSTFAIITSKILVVNEEILIKNGCCKIVFGRFKVCLDMLPLLLLVLVIFLLYCRAIQCLSYWKKRGVLQENPHKLLWNILRFRRKSEPSSSEFSSIYNLSRNVRYVGYYHFTTPILMIKDEWLLRNIAEMDAEYFYSPDQYVLKRDDPLCNINLRDPNWKVYLTNGDLRRMFPILEECCQNFSKNFMKNYVDIIDVRIKDTATSFVNDIIAFTVFDISLDPKDKANKKFCRMIRSITNSTICKSQKFWGHSFVSKILQFLNILYSIDSQPKQYFMDLLHDKLKSRAAKNSTRPDIIQLILETKYEKMQPTQNSTDRADNIEKSPLVPSSIKNSDILAHFLLYLLAGLEPVSNLISFVAIELALDKDIQSKLIKEVDNSFERCNGKMTYDILTKMKYLDMVISEALRKWPYFDTIYRICNQTYVIEPKTSKEKEVVLEKGSVLCIPVTPMHYSPRYYGYSRRFDPERFSSQHRCIIEPYTYLPFGLSEKGCMGSRFAVLQTKIFCVHLLHHFEISVSEATKLPLTLTKEKAHQYVLDRIRLSFERRKN
ncbi:cytochrome P450 9e2-like [Diabrotica virgifera virgifera]|uniref:Uncharacterized protein n=1 Tax=Diabrotica virgifera virgifera TaxID=50390 RepID=A0ABM5KGS6_DIAVI|nr:cytochrome P450 9e2-like [Diabrotica virgifera virgifera]